MIRFLNKLSEVIFPIAVMEKTSDIKAEKGVIKYNGNSILKKDNLIETFNIMSILNYTYDIPQRPSMMHLQAT